MLGAILGSVGGALISGLLNKSAQDSANEANIKLWREQAQWNKPINQLARLQEAGINPNLIYGSGGVQNTITSAPKVEASKWDFSNVFNYQQILNGEKERELVTAQINNENKRSSLIEEDVNSKRLDNKLKELQVDYYEKNGTAPGVGNVAGIIDRFTNFIRSNPRVNPLYYLMDFLGSMNGYSDVDSSAYYKYPEVKVRQSDNDYAFGSFGSYGYIPKYRR